MMSKVNNIAIVWESETIIMVVNWYKNYYTKPKQIYKTSFNQIKDYEKLLKKRSIK